jgi:acetyl esterase/lipase
MAVDGIEISESLVYVTHDGIPLSGDLYLPVGSESYPAVVGVPGGGWSVGHRSALAKWGRHLAANGIGFFSIDYTRSNSSKAFPHAARDVRAAVQFLRGNGERLRINPGRIGLLGASAGAQLASLVALSGGLPPITSAYPGGEYAEIDARVQALIGVYGVYDMLSQWQHGVRNNSVGENNIVERYLGASPFVDPQLYFDASPLRRVTTVANKLPVLLIWGTDDDVVDPRQSIEFALVLRQAGFRVKTQSVLGAGHHWFSDDLIDDTNGFARLCAGPILRTLKAALSG